MSRGITARLRKLEVRGTIDALGGPDAAFPALVELIGEEEAITTIRWYHAGPEEHHWFGSLPPPGWRPWSKAA